MNSPASIIGSSVSDWLHGTYINDSSKFLGETVEVGEAALGARVAVHTLFRSQRVATAFPRAGGHCATGRGSKQVTPQLVAALHLTTACSRPPIAYARSSLRLLAAPEAQRSAATLHSSPYLPTPRCRVRVG